MSVLFSALILYCWILGSGLVLFMFFIARFYEKKYAELYKNSSSNQTYCQLFLLSLALFLIAAVRYALFVGDLAGDIGGDLALFAGGVLLTVLGYHLQRKMTGGRL